MTENILVMGEQEWGGVRAINLIALSLRPPLYPESEIQTKLTKVVLVKCKKSYEESKYRIAFNIYIIITQVQWYYMWLAVVKTSRDFISKVNFLFKVLFILSIFTCYVSCFCVSLVLFVLCIVKFKFVDFWKSCILLSRENKMSIYPRKRIIFSNFANTLWKYHLTSYFYSCLAFIIGEALHTVCSFLVKGC